MGSHKHIRAQAITVCALAAAFAVVSICAVAQQSPPTVRHHRVEEPAPPPSDVDQAEAAMQRSDFATAESLLQKAVAADANDYRAWFDLGYVYNALNRPADAIDAYQKSVAVKPDVFESNLNLGLLLAKQGENAEAAKYLKAATQLKPSNTHPEQSLANAWQALGRVEQSTDPQQAQLAYAEAAKLAPSSPEAHVSAAMALQKQGNLDAAAREYQQALASDPNSKGALSGLASVFIEQKKYADAEAPLRRLAAEDTNNTANQVQLARVLAAEGKNEEAAQELQAVLKANPGDPHAELELGTLYVKAGKDPEGEQQFRLALQKLPQDPGVHLALGSVLMDEHKYPEAEQQLLIAIRLKPDLPDAYGVLHPGCTGGSGVGDAHPIGRQFHYGRGIAGCHAERERSCPPGQAVHCDRS